MTQRPGAGREPGPSTPALRFLATRGRVQRRRPLVVAGGLLARAGVLRAFALWPDAARPVVLMNPADGRAARWMPGAFPERRGAIRLLGPGIWHAFRARGLVVQPRGVPAPIVAAERALGRRLRGPTIAALSPGATIAKTTCFVVERGGHEPVAVVKAMTDPRQRARLEAEADLVEAIRARLADAPSLSASLPASAVGMVALGAETFWVERFDPVIAEAGRDVRTEALAWLAAFQRHTDAASRPWRERDVAAALATLDETTGQRVEFDGLVSAVSSRLRALCGATIPRCAVHGDFWRGNIGLRDGRVRVFDWEWGTLEGEPFLDPWMYEIGPLRAAATDPNLEAELRCAVARVESALDRVGVDPRFAAPMGAVVVAEISSRVRRATGRPSPWEATAPPLLRALRRILADPAPRPATPRASAPADAVP